MNDKTPLRELKGVGEKTEKLFQKIGITTAEELLRCLLYTSVKWNSKKGWNGKGYVDRIIKRQKRCL